MAKIDKCSNVECPIRKKCYRFTSKSNTHQSFIKFEYNNGCKHFWENKHKPTKQII